jgi:tetratricopeptide (TPR) repeat protein
MKSQDELKQTLQLAQQMNQPDLVAQIHVELGYLAFNSEQLDQAKLHFKQALDIGIQTDNKRYIHRGMGNLGAVCGQLGKVQVGNLGTDRSPIIKEALELINQARAIAHETGDKRDELDYCNNLGALYFELGDVSHAMEAFEQGQTLRRTQGQPDDPEVDKLLNCLRRSTRGWFILSR